MSDLAVKAVVKVVIAPFELVLVTTTVVVPQATYGGRYNGIDRSLDTRGDGLIMDFCRPMFQRQSDCRCPQSLSHLHLQYEVQSPVPTYTVSTI